MENDESNQKYLEEARKRGIPNVPKSMSIIQVDVRHTDAYKRKKHQVRRKLTGGVRSWYIT